MTFENQHPVLSLSQLAVEHGWENAGREGLITSLVSPLHVSPSLAWRGLGSWQDSGCAQLMLSLSWFLISSELLVQL